MTSKKILFIGCSGVGKSTLAKKVAEKLNYPLLHLDVIYHIDNNNHISREELMQKVYEFNAKNKTWIMDGTFKSTLLKRLELADTVVLLKLPTKTCVQNVLERSKSKIRDDMAEGFDNTIIDKDFIKYIKNFNKEVLPNIYKDIQSYQKPIKIIELSGYKKMDSFLNNLENYL